MATEQKEEVLDTSEDETDSFDNYGVFQSDYEFKFIQEGNDKTTLMLPPVTYDSMEVKYFNVEIEVDGELLVSALEREKTVNGTTRFFFRIAKPGEQLGQGDDCEIYEKLGEDGYDYGEMKDKATASMKNQKGKKQKPKAAMDAHNYSKPKGSQAKSVPVIKVEGEEPRMLALDGTQIDRDDDNDKEDFNEEDVDEEDYGDDDDDMNDIEEIEVGENMSLDDDDYETSKKTPKRKKVKQEPTSSGKKRRKYDKSKYYSKQSNYFSVEMTEEGNRIYKCSICDYVANQTANIINHVRRHTGERPYGCEHCSMRCYTSVEYKKHLETHNETKSHKCHICGDFFKTKHTLRYHVQKHLKPGAHVCEVCGKSFDYPSALMIHLVTHTGEKRYECDICMKRFSYKNALERHLKIHVGGEYRCHICEKVFIRKDYWRQHLIKEHHFSGEEDFLAKAKKRVSRLYQMEENSAVALKMPLDT